MKLTTYNPGKNIDPWFNSGWEPYFSHTLADFFPTENAKSTYPKVNIVENENEFTLTAEVPGWVDENIDVEIKDGVLSLRGHVKEESEKNDEHFNIREFRSQNFERSFRLGEQVDPEKVTAKLESGILRVSLGKKEIAKPKKVEIKVNP
ncbi:MAG: hypothetical protein NPINA01_04020 [Nitrospinaceae bacterium]|nr:MAG: hypothetical protein NPINA01_04020 [Nitrospinaceae bacterium]